MSGIVESCRDIDAPLSEHGFQSFGKEPVSSKDEAIYVSDAVHWFLAEPPPDISNSKSSCKDSSGKMDTLLKVRSYGTVHVPATSDHVLGHRFYDVSLGISEKSYGQAGPDVSVLKENPSVSEIPVSSSDLSLNQVLISKALSSSSSQSVICKSEVSSFPAEHINCFGSAWNGLMANGANDLCNNSIMSPEHVHNGCDAKDARARTDYSDSGSDDDLEVEPNTVLSQINHHPGFTVVCAETLDDTGSSPLVSEILKDELSLAERDSLSFQFQLPHNVFYIQRMSDSQDMHMAKDSLFIFNYRVQNCHAEETGHESELTGNSNFELFGNVDVGTCKADDESHLTRSQRLFLVCLLCHLKFGAAESFVTHAKSVHCVMSCTGDMCLTERKSAILHKFGKDCEPTISSLELVSVKSVLSAHPDKLESTTGADRVSKSPSCESELWKCPNHQQSKTFSSFVQQTIVKNNENDMDSSGNGMLSKTNSEGKLPSLMKGADNESKISGTDLSMSDIVEQDRKTPKKLSLDVAKKSSQSNISPEANLPDETVDTSNVSSTSFSRPFERHIKTEITADNLEPMPSRSDHVFTHGVKMHPGTESYSAFTSSPEQKGPNDYDYLSGVETNPAPESLRCDELEPVGVFGLQLPMQQSRNSCKMLKCPRCNWHYKYQETLEIHMREKHPETDAQCVYCIGGQPHPRLARGEAYTCGYKPYRCDVCNYSTTTKGNLSIHMQSDRHMNNVQEVQSVGARLAKSPPTPPPSTMSSDVCAFKKSKPKPSWRCDVCNYETNVARNLRIHMTSEKHAHNILVMQQTSKSMPTDLQMQLNHMAMVSQDTSSLLALSNPWGLAPFGFEQSMFMPPPLPRSLDLPVDLTRPIKNSVEPPTGLPDWSNSNDLESPMLYQCMICNAFGTDSLEALHQHEQLDRTGRGSEHEGIIVIAGTYICSLCQYKSNLKANFQLHCKTDKHLQRLQLINHIREGRPNVEWCHLNANLGSLITVRCNACDYSTNSVYKMQIHSSDKDHNANVHIFLELLSREKHIGMPKAKFYNCATCNFTTRARVAMIQHASSAQHCAHEQQYLAQLGQRDDGTGSGFQFGPFSVQEFSQEEKGVFGDQDHNEGKNRRPDQILNCPMTNEYKKHINENGKHITESFSVGRGETVEPDVVADQRQLVASPKQSHPLGSPPLTLTCRLCLEGVRGVAELESHLVQIHSVKPQVLKFLLKLVEQNGTQMSSHASLSDSNLSRFDDWVSGHSHPSAQHQSDVTATIPEADVKTEVTNYSNLNLAKLEIEGLQIAKNVSSLGRVLLGPNREQRYQCQTCGLEFLHVNSLYAHQTELGHLELKQTKLGPSYPCWHPGCNEVFSTAIKVQAHHQQIHVDGCTLATGDGVELYQHTCTDCSLTFRHLDHLRIHQVHHLVVAAEKCSICLQSFESLVAAKEHSEMMHPNKSNEEASLLREAIQALTSLSAMSQLNSHMEQTEEAMETDAVEEMPGKSDRLDFGNIGCGMGCGVCRDDDTLGSVEQQKELQESMDMDDDHEDSDEESMRCRIKMELQQIPDDKKAAGHYSDPNFKYKCHRCKMAFFRQSHLSAHNKMSVHRRGDHANNPVDKYLDLDRPFKCDVCRESFTQKNILLVHYNSVSHLHKVKHVMSQLSNGTVTSSSQQIDGSRQAAETQFLSHLPLTVSEESIDSETAVGKQGQVSVVNNEVHRLSPGDDNHGQPQGFASCLVKDHERTRVDALELSEDGKRVLSQIKTEQLQQEQSDGEELLKKFDDQTVQKLNTDQIHFEDRKPARSARASADDESCRTTMANDDYNRHKYQKRSEHVSSWSSTLSSAENFPVYSFPSISSSETSASANFSSSGVGADTSVASAHFSQPGSFHPTAQIFSCSKCITTFSSHDDLACHQQTGCMFAHQTPRSPPKTFYYRSLLENIGFECVMQFNESSQQGARVLHEKERKLIESLAKSEFEFSCEKDEKLVKIPELSKSVCDQCRKEFSSIWVLKTHKEEVHKETIPLFLIEEFASEFKKYYELRLPTPIPSSSEAPQSPVAMDLGGMVSTNHASLAGAAEAAGYISRNMSSQMMHQMSMMLPFDMMGFGLPLGMNLLPPVLPMMMPFSHPSEFYGIPGLGLLDPTLLLSSHQQFAMPPPQPFPPAPQPPPPQQPQQVQNSLTVAQQKRARTRISDEQLSILRAHFDISNSPSDEQVAEMAEKTKLPPKVIKHWFRNTLFKERQRSKDSPYNFSIPPTTILEAETEKLNVSEIQNTSTLSADSGHRSTVSRCDSATSEMKQENFCLETQSTRSSDSFDEGLRHSDSSTPLSVLTQTVFSMGPQNTPSRFVPSSNFCLPVSLSGHTNAAMSCGALFGVASLSATQQGQNQIRDTSSTRTTSHGKRANRTHFTDHQIKILQEHFELNAYPKDEELEMLSRLLELSPRVIIVWFQNARQKARKTYENQPPIDGTASATSACGGGVGGGDNDTQTQSCTASGLKYQCPICLVVFERYYELIKHQRAQCNRDSKALQPDSQMSPIASECSSSDESLRNQLDFEAGKAAKEKLKTASPTKGDDICEKGNETFESLEKQEDHEDNAHQSQVNSASSSARSAFNVLKDVASQQGPCSSGSGGGSFPDEQASYEEVDDSDTLRDRRMRTTILPEQLEYLSLKYKADCNPSRKQLSAIAAEVGLKKRVVQVWFQNTRARERKGQYRIHSQPMSSPGFHHSQQFFPTGSAISKPQQPIGKHVEKQSNVLLREELNVNAEEVKYNSPGYEGGNTHGVDFAQLINNPYNLPSPFLPLVPPLNLIYGREPFKSETEFSKSSFRKSLDMLSGSRTEIQKSFSTAVKDEPFSHRSDNLDVPLDLSKTYRVNYESKSSAAAAAGAMFGTLQKTTAAATDTRVSFTRSCDDSLSESQSEFVENNDDVNQGAEGKGQSSRISASVQSSQGQTFPGKRHRTHMSNLQIRVMKAIYADYKTPTIAECDALGHEIGLRKRVVQVWFQNARAKDKKNRLAADGSVYNGGGDVESLQVPDQCLYCPVKYSTQFTLRDHLFSTQHIDIVKKFVRTQADLDNRSAVEDAVDGNLKSVRKSAVKKYHSSPSSLPSAESLGDDRTTKSGAVPPGSAYDADKHSVAYPAAVKSEKGPSLSLGETKTKADLSVTSRSDPQVVDSCFMSIIGGSSHSSSMVNPDVASTTNSPQKISPYGPSFYPSLPGMLPFMYPGLGSFYPGLDVPFLPSQLASAGMESFYLSDPTLYGLPLSLLQISRPSLQSIQEKVSDKETTVARYTDDSMTFADLKSVVSDCDFSVACESSVDVGYICKQCHLVFPGYSACTNHQQNSCFLGKMVEKATCTVKLVQTVYECTACQTKLSTVADFKVHCNLESHRLKVSGST